MGQATKHAYGEVAQIVRQRIDSAKDRLWRFDDFRDLPSQAVAQVLSRLARQGSLERLSKGTYYRPRQTAFGKSLPNPSEMKKLATKRSSVFPSGLPAANLLGFTTQTAQRNEVATSSSSLPRKLIGQDTLVRPRRPTAWEQLSQADAALLDFLRQGGQNSELTPEDTVHRTLALASEPGRFERLLKVAATEPPRVRALLGAIGESLGKRPSILMPLRTSLNPLSRFDFGALSRLPKAQRWQAKKPQ